MVANKIVAPMERREQNRQGTNLYSTLRIPHYPRKNNGKQIITENKRKFI